MRIAHLCVVILFAAVAAGCLERKERLSISPKGQVLIEVTYRTDSQSELLEGDTMPSPQAGWATEHTTDKDAEGNISHRLTAIASFPRGYALPGNFAPRNDSDADICLQFPTTVVMEKRRDGTYCHFRRVYTARPMATFERLKSELVNKPLESLNGEPDSWTNEQRIMIVQSLAHFEVEKLLIFAREAWRKETPKGPQDGWLALSADLRAFVAQLDYSSLAALIVPKNQQQPGPETGDTEHTIDSESKRLQAEMAERLRTGLRDLAGFDGSQVNAFMREFDRQRKFFDVTQDLTDEKFEISVEMPGSIVASNADEVSGRTAVWKFDGDRMQDADFELLATSLITK